MKKIFIIALFSICYIFTLAQNIPLNEFLRSGNERTLTFTISDNGNLSLVELTIRYRQTKFPVISIVVNGNAIFTGIPDNSAITSGNISFDITDLIRNGTNSLIIKNLSVSPENFIYLEKINIKTKRKNDISTQKFSAGDRVVATEDYGIIKKGFKGTYKSAFARNNQFACVVWDRTLTQPSSPSLCPILSASEKNRFYLYPKKYLKIQNTINSDNIPPQIDFDTKTEQVSSTNFTIKGKAYDNNSGLYAVFVNRIKSNDYIGNFTAIINLQNEINTIIVTAYDKAGNKSQKTKIVKRITKDTIKPKIEKIISPAQNNITIDSNKIKITGIAKDDQSIKYVHCYVNNREVSQLPVDINGNFSYEAILNKGRNTIKFIAEDLSGNISKPYIINIRFAPERSKPVISVLNPVLVENKVIIRRSVRKIEIKTKIQSKYSLKNIKITKINSPVSIDLVSEGNNIYKKIVNLPLEDTIKITIIAENTFGINSALSFSLIREKLNDPYPSVDNAPVLQQKCDSCYALIIGNADYSQNPVYSDLPYALNDAQVFKQYLINTFGFEEKNITFVKNTDVMSFIDEIRNFQQKIKIYPNGIFFFYYSGHGGLTSDNSPMFIPKKFNPDKDPSEFKKLLILDSVFYKLTFNNPKRLVVFLDMCYSGRESKGFDNQEYKSFDLNGNIIIFSAAGQKEAFAFKERNHSLFTYALLKVIYDNALKNKTLDNLTYSRLLEETDFLMQKIIVDKNLGIEQKPAVFPSLDIEEEWKNWKIP